MNEKRFFKIWVKKQLGKNSLGEEREDCKEIKMQ